jgi:hypothetical protein
MKALTVRQPWAWAISSGHKRVENRSWATRYRGQLAIHAGLAWDQDGVAALLELCDFGQALPPKWWTEPGVLPAGAVVAVVDLIGVCSETVSTMRRAPLGQVWCGCGPWAVPGAHHWQRDDVRGLAEPVPCRGAQGIWTVPDDVAGRINDQLRAVAR